MFACSPAFNPLVLEKNVNCGGPSMIRCPSVIQHTRLSELNLYFPEIKVSKNTIVEKGFALYACPD